MQSPDFGSDLVSGLIVFHGWLGDICSDSVMDNWISSKSIFPSAFLSMFLPRVCGARTLPSTVESTLSRPQPPAAGL